MSKRKKRSSGNPARRGLSFNARVVAREFESWMAAADATFIEPAAAGTGIQQLLTVTSRAGLDLLDPDAAEYVIDALEDMGSRGEDLLDVFHDYVHFQVNRSRADEWDEAHELIEELLEPDDGVPEVIADALRDAALIDPGKRRAALAGLRMVAVVVELLQWLGSGRPITDSGALRRADIAPVAALLGLSARGVAKRPRAGEYRGGAIVVDGEAHVQSMWDLPDLAAWWNALIGTGLIELTGTRVRRGPTASLWSAEAMPPLDDAAAVTSAFVAQVLAGGLQVGPDAWATAGARLTLTLALAALEPDSGRDTAEPRDAIEGFMRPAAVARLQRLVGMGVVVEQQPDRFVVPEMLRGVFAQGVTLAVAFVADTLAEDLGEFDGDVPHLFDDPDVKAEMARLGVVHKPGMAAELMKDFKPLLAEEGVDLDHLDGDDLGAVNAALARATERHNLELFTPVGERRAMALTVHRLVAEALAEGSDDLARVVMDGIQPDPQGDLPSVAHVIGVGLGILDQWMGDPARASMLRNAKVPTWDAGAMRAAQDILTEASQGRSFDGLHGLHMRYNGKLVLVGTMLAVAGAVAALAAGERIGVREMVGRVLVEG